jgi:hypothetical protein
MAEPTLILISAQLAVYKPCSLAHSKFVQKLHVFSSR